MQVKQEPIIEKDTELYKGIPTQIPTEIPIEKDIEIFNFFQCFIVCPVFRLYGILPAGINNATESTESSPIICSAKEN